MSKRRVFGVAKEKRIELLYLYYKELNKDLREIKGRTSKGCLISKDKVKEEIEQIQKSNNEYTNI